MSEAEIIWSQIDEETKCKWDARLPVFLTTPDPCLIFLVSLKSEGMWTFKIVLDPSDTYTVTLTGLEEGGQIIFQMEATDIYCDVLGEVITRMCEAGEEKDKPQLPINVSESKLIEVNANDLWDNPNHINFRFCDKCSRAKADTGAMFLMDGTSYSYQVENAKKFGCTSEFLEVYNKAIEAGGVFVLFYHDV